MMVFAAPCATVGMGKAFAQNTTEETVPSAAPAEGIPQAASVPLPMAPAATQAKPTVASDSASAAKAPDPFAFADFGWMNGQSRQTDYPLAGKIFNPMFTIDVGYNYDFSNPVDHTIVGSTSAGRSN